MSALRDAVRDANAMHAARRNYFRRSLVLRQRAAELVMAGAKDEDVRFLVYRADIALNAARAEVAAK